MIKELDPIGVTSPAVLAKMNEMIRMLNVFEVQLEYLERIVGALRRAAQARGELASQTTLRQHSSEEPSNPLPPPQVVPPLKNEPTGYTPLKTELCEAGPTYSHPAHEWVQDYPGGEPRWCPGASTDRT